MGKEDVKAYAVAVGFEALNGTGCISKENLNLKSNVQFRFVLFYVNKNLQLVKYRVERAKLQFLTKENVEYFTNLELKGNQVLITNGSHERYPGMSKESSKAYTVLFRLENKDGNVRGYCVCGGVGEPAIVSVAEAVSLHNQGLITNTKTRLVGDSTILQSIKGDFPVVSAVKPELKEKLTTKAFNYVTEVEKDAIDTIYRILDLADKRGNGKSKESKQGKALDFDVYISLIYQLYNRDRRREGLTGMLLRFELDNMQWGVEDEIFKGSKGQKVCNAAYEFFDKCAKLLPNSYWGTLSQIERFDVSALVRGSQVALTISANDLVYVEDWLKGLLDRKTRPVNVNFILTNDKLVRKGVALSVENWSDEEGSLPQVAQYDIDGVVGVVNSNDELSKLAKVWGKIKFI